MAKKKITKSDKPKVNPELRGFDIQVNSFGEIITNYNVDKINDFLNKHVDDKKLRDRDDLHVDRSALEEGEEKVDELDNELDDELFGDLDEEEKKELGKRKKAKKLDEEE